MTDSADYAESVIDKAPPELADYFRCQKWRVLLRDGGLDNQPLSRFLAMESAGQCYNAFVARLKAKSVVDFAKNNPKLVEYCLEIDELRQGSG